MAFSSHHIAQGELKEQNPQVVLTKRIILQSGLLNIVTPFCEIDRDTIAIDGLHAEIIKLL